MNRIKPFSVNYHALVPYPGTPVYQRLKEEGRLIYQDYPNDWQHYFPGNVVFVPKNMSPERLQEGVDSAWKDASSLRNIVGRILSSNHPIQAAVFNLGYKFRKNYTS